MRPISFLALFILILAAGILAGATGPMADDHGKTRVEARQWSKVDGVVHYSGWKPFYARTIDQLAGFKKADSAAPVTLYGGDPERRFRVTGFYYTVKERGRWWIVDPEGYANINAAVNGVRPGTSPRNEKALSEKYGSNEKWINDTHRRLEALVARIGAMSA